MKSYERHEEILRILCDKRRTTAKELGEMLNTSLRNIRRDVAVLSLHYPIYTVTGRYGGIYIMDGYFLDRLYVSAEETRVLQKAYATLREQAGSALDLNEYRIFHNILRKYSNPKVKETKHDSKRNRTVSKPV